MKLKLITVLFFISIFFPSVESIAGDAPSFSQQTDNSNIYLKNAYSALNSGQLNRARNYYKRYKEISGKSDSLFESELRKANGSYIWTEKELLSAGFKVTKNFDDHFNDRMRYATISNGKGLKGLIQDSYKDAELISGSITRGYINGLTLLKNNDCMELAYVCMGKVMAPSIAVVEMPFMTVDGEDPHKAERDYLFINEDVVMDQYNFKTGEGDVDWIPYIRRIFSPDVTNQKFLYNLSIGKVDMNAIRRHFSNFVRKENKIPSHLWGYK